MAISAWAVAVLRYSFEVLDWRKDELRTMDRMTRDIMTMHGALHPKSDVDRVYVSQNNRGRGLANVEMYARTEDNNLAFYVKISSEHFLAGAKVSIILNCVESKEKTLFKREIQNENIARWIGKKMY